MLENLNRHIIIIFDFSESFRRNFQTQVFPLPKSYFRQIAQFSLISASTRCTCTDQSKLIFSERKFWSIISHYKFSIFFISQPAFVFSWSLYAPFPIFKRPALLVRRLFDKKLPNCESPQKIMYHLDFISVPHKLHKQFYLCLLPLLFIKKWRTSFILTVVQNVE